MYNQSLFIYYDVKQELCHDAGIYKFNYYILVQRFSRYYTSVCSLVELSLMLSWCRWSRFPFCNSILNVTGPFFLTILPDNHFSPGPKFLHTLFLPLKTVDFYSDFHDPTSV